MEKVENPKVFISYCWSNDAYITKVVEFAQRMRVDGINVVLDKFQMKLGNDMNNFMEKCVSDPSVTNVLILLTPDYKTKADSRSGGAGRETQIISGEVYSNAENTKFIPILFEKRGEDAAACIPTYLQQRRYLDMSEDSDFEEKYMELVKVLYGREKYVENPLGSKPEWIDETRAKSATSQIIINTFKALKNEYGENRALSLSFNRLIRTFEEIKSSFKDFKSYNASNFENYYSFFEDIKNPYLGFLLEIGFDNNIGKRLHDFFGDILKIIAESRTEYPVFMLFSKIFLHELFIETTAILIKAKNYTGLSYLTTTPYVDYFSNNRDLGYFKDVFYSNRDIEIYNLSIDLGSLLQSDPNKGSYYSGVAEYWKRHIPAKYLNFSELIDADCLLTNISISMSDRYWFALSYCYLSNRETSLIKKISISLKSQSLSSDYYCLFGWKSLDDAKNTIKALSEYTSKHELRLSYPGSFYGIPLLSDYIKIEEIGSMR